MKFINDFNREAIIKSFNDNASKAGWGKDLYGSIDIDSESQTAYKVSLMLDWGKDYSKEEMESLEAFVKTQKVNINVKDFVKPL